NPTTGVFTVTVSDTVAMGGVTVTRTTGDGFSSGDGSDSPSAVKTYVTAGITITPLTPVNEVNHAETFTIIVTAAGTRTPTFGTPTVTFPSGTPATPSGPTLVTINGTVPT